MKDNLGGRTLEHDSMSDANVMSCDIHSAVLQPYSSQMMSLCRHKVVGGEGTMSFPLILCEKFDKHESVEFSTSSLVNTASRSSVSLACIHRANHGSVWEFNPGRVDQKSHAGKKMLSAFVAAVQIFQSN